MSQNFQAGDFLIFQIESGYALLRILDIETTENGEIIWHLSAFNELFLDVETAEKAIGNPTGLTLSKPHFAITQRAFDATQVARLVNRPIEEVEMKLLENWRASQNPGVSDRSARLMLGLR